MSDTSIVKDGEYTKPNYDIWLIWAHGMYCCNLQCIYCANQESVNDSAINFFKRKLFSREIIPAIPKKQPLRVSVAAEPIHTDKLLASLAVHKKIFRITFAAGEPFVIPNIVEACQQITAAGHHLGFNTNLTSENVLRLLETVAADKFDYFVASLHFWEIARCKKEKIFIRNYHALKERNIIMTVTAVAHPLLRKELSRYLRFYKEQGILIKFDPFRGFFNGKRYPEAYTAEEIQLFSLEKYDNYFSHKDTPCNAGYNVIYANPQGQVFPCASLVKEEQSLGHVYSGFTLRPDVQKCAEKFCGCPYKYFDHHQYRRALHETGREQFICR